MTEGIRDIDYFPSNYSLCCVGSTAPIVPAVLDRRKTIKGCHILQAQQDRVVLAEAFSDSTDPDVLQAEAALLCDLARAYFAGGV